MMCFQKVDVLCGISVKKVACGTQFSVALTRDGRVFTFGQGALGSASRWSGSRKLPLAFFN